MAEAWRLEDEEEELREFGRRHRRRNLNSAADRSERNKPDYRSSGCTCRRHQEQRTAQAMRAPGSMQPSTKRRRNIKNPNFSPSQGPLSSIRAAIKRTSRTSSHTEHQRDRRRPEITIVAAEPLRPSSWFPGGNVTPQGLGFPPPSQTNWRTNELVPAELPPSYEQVIKEINQVQVNTTNNNNAAAASRCTATSATQTDFPEEIISHLPRSNVKNNLPTLCESEIVQAVQSPLKPPRPLLNSNPSENEAPLVVSEVSEEWKCQENPSNVTGPLPKPRSKGNLRPVVRDIQSKSQDNQEEVSQPRAEREPSPSQPVSLLDNNLLDNHMVMNSMNTEKSQNSIGSRIKAFESQANSDISGLSKKPEIAPRSFVPRPTVSTKKPIIAPKPELGARRASGESGSWTENTQKDTSRKWHPQPQEARSNVITKPELPKKPKPGLVKSTSNDLLDARNGSASENNDEQKKFPVPAPRPLVPKKSLSVESPAPHLTLLKPTITAPSLSVATQATAFKSLRESSAPTNLSTCTLQSKPVGEGDLISFDDDVLPPSSVSAVQECTSSEADVLRKGRKTSWTKQVVVVLLPPLSALSTVEERLREPHGGIFYSLLARTLTCNAGNPKSNSFSSADKGKNCPGVSHIPDPFQFSSKTEPAKEQTVQPAIARKPTVIRIPSKPGKSLNEVPHIPPPLPAEKPIGNTSGIVAGKPSNAKQTRKGESEHSDPTGTSWTEPVLPPRPVDGKIVPARLPPPKGIPGRPPPPKHSGTKTSSQKDPFCRSSSDLTLHKRHDMFGMGVKRAKSQVLKNQDPALPPRPKPGHTLYNKYMLPVPHGIAKEDFSPRNPGELGCKDSNNIQRVSDKSAPHAVVLHDFPAEHADDLDLHSGETVYLLEKIDNEWYRGKLGNRTGIFPANFVKVIIDVPEEENRKKVLFSSPCIKGPRCVARFEYIGDQKDELSFSEGEIILLKEYVNEEWASGELKGTSGIFPLNFVEIIEDLPGLGVGAPLKNKRESSACLSQTDRQSGEWCEALHDFTAETNEDLSFKKGDYIQILEHVDSEWCRGRLNDSEGIFPAVFVQTCSAGVKTASPGCRKGKAKALYDFQGENEDELSFKAGDMITELEPVDEDWMSGEVQGKSGIFPKNFVQVL
ncbi:SH3 domain-containing protein 19 isoform X2 [Chrysemys picta bellii]|uniref:SH3 domain-containing protein 19 isoform X2 n=1 Tax=Chrysemys picta bellii TaxID=8478 RepID=UPI0032B27407